MQSNRSLQGLRITSPFVVEALESFGSRELQILDLQNTIKQGELPGLLRVICTNQASLTELNLAKNDMTASGAIILAESLEGNQILTELNISSNDMGKRGAIALANIIPGMGAMMSLNLASNRLGVEGAKIIATILPNCT
jgi:Ran GTPase-activating protein (RanGAP) involved in mRNA processing and transport